MDVGVEDVQGIEFLQKGYIVNIVSSHDVDAFITQPDGSPMKLKIKVVSVDWNSTMKSV